MTVAYGIMDEQNVITIFIEAAVDLVGRYDRTKNVTSKNYDKKLRSENSTETFSSEAHDEIITRRSRITVIRDRAELHKYLALQLDPV